MEEPSTFLNCHKKYNNDNTNRMYHIQTFCHIEFINLSCQLIKEISEYKSYHVPKFSCLVACAASNKESKRSGTQEQLVIYIRVALNNSQMAT